MSEDGGEKVVAPSLMIVQTGAERWRCVDFLLLVSRVSVGIWIIVFRKKPVRKMRMPV